jgi:hypothetical protein
LLAVVSLKRAGFSLQQIKKAVGELRARGYHSPLASLNLVAVGNDIAWKEATDVEEYTAEARATSALLLPGQGIFVFPIGEQHAVLLRQLESLEQERDPVVARME